MPFVQYPPRPPERAPGSLVWPLPRKPRWRDTLGDGRPTKAAPDFPRHHAGLDIDADLGELVLAMHGGVVRRIMGWSGRTEAVIIDDGITSTLYGGLAPGSTEALGLDVGDEVPTGEPIGHIGAYPRGGTMLHIEVRKARSPAEAKWWFGKAPPTHLLDPRPYLELAQGMVRRPRPVPAAPGPAPTRPARRPAARPAARPARPPSEWQPPPPSPVYGGSAGPGGAWLLLALLLAGELDQ